MKSTDKDIALHAKAVIALRHHYKHGDVGGINRVLDEMPETNRKEAMIRWFLKFSAAKWQPAQRHFRGGASSNQEQVFIAEEQPFWELKVPRSYTRHISGNTFHPDEFLNRALQEIERNLLCIPKHRLLKFLRDIESLYASKYSGPGQVGASIKGRHDVSNS